jgi:hypothetical protein
MGERGWIVEHVGTESFERLASGLAGSELQSVLLEVMQRRAEARSPQDVLAQFARDPFCAPSPVDQRVSNEIDAHLLAMASAFEAMELSPVAPLGACSSVALTDQNRVLSALRSSEIVSDPTNVLVLECAARLRARPGTTTHLTTSQRVIRAQFLPKIPGYTQHFRIFVLASGGVETQAHGFTVDAMLLHVRTMLAALDRLEQNGYAFGKRRIDILSTPARKALGERIVEALGSLAVHKPLEHAYYSAGLRYQIWVTDADGAELPLVDGGSFDWLSKITSNRRAVYVASGAGAQLMALRFRAPAELV